MESLRLLPGKRVMVEGGATEEISIELDDFCLPLRPCIPSYCAVEFDVVGVRRLCAPSDDEVVVAEDCWPKADGFCVPASIFSSMVVDFNLGLSRAFRKGDSLILLVKNLSNGPRQFAFAWLVDPS